MDQAAPDLTFAVRERASLAPVELRATHASWVFIAGADVWKVKRPVDLGFLDFTTVEARRRFCEEEVRLNRRLAPDVYLGVEAITRGPHGLALGGAGPVVDWAVHMRRLPDEGSAAAMLARGALDADALARLAERLAEFHRASRPSPAFGELATLRVNVEENFAQTERFVHELVDPATFEETRAAQVRWLDAHSELLRARVAAGRVRDGHGDVRLEHVYFLPDAAGDARPTVIDCIEFNERFRCADVASDVAFLAMELELVRRPDLAAGFVARFAEASEDFELYGVLDFYLAYRAWVRGKVAAFVADDAAAAPEARRAKRLEARRDFALARSYAGLPLDAPFVVAVCGIIGSGKSTLASALGRELGVPVIASDRVRKALAGLAPTARGGPELYADASRARAYDEVFRRAACVLDARRAVVLDATFSDPSRRAQAGRLALDAGAKLVFVELECDEATLRERLARRRAGGSVSDATDEQLDELARRHRPADPSEGAPVVRVDGGQPPRCVVDQALAGLALHGVTQASDRRAS